jgi:adenosine/AMP kinase
MGEIINFPSERNRAVIRAVLGEAALLAVQIEDLQQQRDELLRSIGMGTTKSYESREDPW